MKKYSSCDKCVFSTYDEYANLVCKLKKPVGATNCGNYIVTLRKSGIESESESKENDMVNHPSHYNKGGIECLEIIKAILGDKYEGFLIGNVLKYIYRYPDKNGLEDCKKARFYLDEFIKEAESKENKNFMF